jgi:glycosyltransferase involved in cell wall biosynthesis
MLICMRGYTVPEQVNTLRLCLVGPVPPPAGGMANQTRQLKQLLQQDGTDVELVAVNAPYRPAFIGRLPGLRALFRLLPYLFALYRAIGRAQVVHVMANSGWSWHLFAAPALVIARLRRTPVILNYRGGHAESFFAQSWQRVHFTLRYASAVLVPSPFLQQVFARYQQNSAIVPNILDHTQFYPAKQPKALQQEPISAPHCIVTRNLEAIYDVTSAINAFHLLQQEYPAARLTIAGTGPLLAQLQQQVQQLGLNHAVHFAGRLDINQMAQLYRSADIMLNSSLVDNSPNSVIEAMACAVPVVSTNVGGIPQLVTAGKDALLVDAGDYQAMYAYARQLCVEPSLRAALVQHGLQNSQRFFWQTVSQQLLVHYHSAIAGYAGYKHGESGV